MTDFGNIDKNFDVNKGSTTDNVSGLFIQFIITSAAGL